MSAVGLEAHQRRAYKRLRAMGLGHVAALDLVVALGPVVAHLAQATGVGRDETMDDLIGRVLSPADDVVTARATLRPARAGRDTPLPVPGAGEGRPREDRTRDDVETQPRGE